MDGIALYIVCHGVTYPGNHSDFTDAEAVDAGLRWYVVNEPLQPKVIRCPEGCRIDEWGLPVHDPFMQINHFYNNSALWHAYLNPGLRTREFIGFAQYDMAIPKRALDRFAATPGPRRVGAMFPLPFACLFQNPLPAAFWEELVREAHPGLEIANLTGDPLPLMHGFIMPTPAFVEMMQFADSWLPKVLRALGHDTRHLAGTLERVFALWIAAKGRAGVLGPILELPGFVHGQETQRLPDAFRDAA